MLKHNLLSSPYNRAGRIRKSVLPASLLFAPASNQVLQTLERHYLDDVLCRLGLEHHFFLGEGIDSLVLGHGRLANDLDLNQPVQGERAGAFVAEVLEISLVNSSNTPPTCCFVRPVVSASAVRTSVLFMGFFVATAVLASICVPFEGVGKGQ
jgi:hypothetical protein